MFALSAHAQAPVSSLLRRNARRGSAARQQSRRQAVRAMAGNTPPPSQEPEEEEEAKIDWSGLKQLVKMGLGTISGDITEINLDDPARTVVMELEANNFEDADGKPLNFMNNEGVVAEEGDTKPMMNFVAPVVLGAAAIGGVVATLNAL